MFFLGVPLDGHNTCTYNDEDDRRIGVMNTQALDDALEWWWLGHERIIMSRCMKRIMWYK